ncbi:beta-lactamase/transpeptidase-like protein [Hyaloscypha variabilis F]|uniref:Beta-lactamase/transpeptidase-like protein n=1 Tax=Hyaloscypha variabilis (strain UAMH 11265 / GT02V1 / F) TaxID=1149755 RepID=A0A2J6S8I7_HYAVF|nr:beta-lactamase/transpeptidase-like protein [Hyaloscypha variabilis F]
MRPPTVPLLLIVHLSSRAAADFSGPSYPAPVDLSSNQSLVAASWTNITSTLEIYTNDGNLSTFGTASQIKNLTFSLGMFSLNDPKATELQFHYTSPEIANSSNGTRKVDEDSIYRIASLTKAFTILTGLINLNDTDWDRPLTDIFPALAGFAEKEPGEGNPVYVIPWDKVTPSALAAQISGVTRDILPFNVNDIALAIVPSVFEPGLGLPPVNSSDPRVVTPCVLTLLVNGTVCSTVPYLESASLQAPAFEPWTTPAYANNGFVLLGRAISAITSKSMEQLYQDSIFGPLGMASSNSSTPPESEWYRAVIPGAVTNFALDAGVLVSTGGLLSTTRDIATFGISILNSTLLSPDQTRKWLKPVSHTARLQYSVGRPWEIIRYTHASGHITDMYTKLGDSGTYSSWMVLLPDYKAGFSILSAGTMDNRFEVLAAIMELVADSILPALEAKAGIEAEQYLGGTYTSTIPGLNSSLTLTHDQTETASPGLVVESWISNGTDMLTRLEPAVGPPPWRLLPSISDARNEKAAFWLVSALDAPSPEPPLGLFSGFENQDWLNVDSLAYGDVGVGSFVFDLGTDGKAQAVTIPAARITLESAR